MQLESKYWNSRYADNSAVWDIGHVSAPIKEYIDQLKNKDISILIPGCGNAHEAEYLVEQGFTDVTLLDYSEEVIQKVKERFRVSGGKINVVCDDFFNHSTRYDLIIEQTFFCALNPHLRSAYVEKMVQLLNVNGKLVGLLFDRSFEINPPFGEDTQLYRDMFSPLFNFITFEKCYNSIEKRKESELFINFSKKEAL